MGILRTISVVAASTVLLGTLTLLGSPPPAEAAEPASPAAKGGIITRAMLASASTPITRSPLGITDTFPPDVKAIYVNVEVANAPINTALRFDWIAVDIGSVMPRNTKLSSTHTTAQGSTNVSMAYPSTSSPYPVGTYKMEIYLNGKLDRTLKMTVRENVPAFVPPPLRAIGSCPPPPKPVYRPPLVARRLTPAEGVTSAVEPINPTREFKPTSKFHVIADLDNPPANSKVKAIWYALDTGGAEPCNTRLGETEITSSGRRVWFNWSVAPEKYPVGIYRVEIYVNGNLNNDVDLRVFQ